MKRVTYNKDAAKAMASIPANMSRLIREKIEQYAKNPESLANNVVKLQGRPGLRLRVGSWRVIFDEDRETVAVRAVRPRGNAYS